jgi:hypothetical protein
VATQIILTGEHIELPLHFMVNKEAKERNRKGLRLQHPLPGHASNDLTSFH